jgi:hypothetical protein
MHCLCAGWLGGFSSIDQPLLGLPALTSHDIAAPSFLSMRIQKLAASAGLLSPSHDVAALCFFIY